MQREETEETEALRVILLQQLTFFYDSVYTSLPDFYTLRI
jgi:hypothetical protein